MLKVESEVLARSLAFFFLNKSGKLKYAVIFSHKGKTIHHSKLQIVLFVCSHNINKTFCKIKKQTGCLDLE